jgi:hypothetical protein
LRGNKYQKVALVLGYQSRTANDGKHVDSLGVPLEAFPVRVRAA